MEDCLQEVFDKYHILEDTVEGDHHSPCYCLYKTRKEGGTSRLDYGHIVLFIEEGDDFTSMIKISEIYHDINDLLPTIESRLWVSKLYKVKIELIGAGLIISII